MRTKRRVGQQYPYVFLVLGECALLGSGQGCQRRGHRQGGREVGAPPVRRALSDTTRPRRCYRAVVAHGAPIIGECAPAGLAMIAECAPTTGAVIASSRLACRAVTASNSPSTADWTALPLIFFFCSYNPLICRSFLEHKNMSSRGRVH